MGHPRLDSSLRTYRRASAARLVRLSQQRQRQSDLLMMETSPSRVREPRRQLLIPYWQSAPWRQVTCRNDAWLAKGHGPLCARKGGWYNFLPSRTLRDKDFLASRKSLAWLIPIPTADQAFIQ